MSTSIRPEKPNDARSVFVANVDDDGNASNTDSFFSTCEINPNPIPTVSDWGMVITLLLLLAGGTILIERRRAIGETAHKFTGYRRALRIPE